MNFVKSIFLTLAVALTSLVAVAQPQLLEPVAWSTSVEQIAEGEYRVDFKASVADGWHLYDLGPYEGGPISTTFTFDPIEGYELVGEVTASRESVREMSEIFEMEIGHYEGDVVFSQIVKAPKGATVKGLVEWQACSDQCVNGEKEFSIKVGNPAEKAAAAVDVADTASKGGSIWGFILSAMGWALIALLTPCVFPMIPMTVSFFLKGSGSAAKGRFRALMYGLFIVVLYTVPIGVIIFLTWLIGGDAVTADIFNWLSTHWLPNILFFIVFMVFAASFFGAFEIVLPEKLVNNSDAKADKGGLVGIFFMALTLVLVSFSCTGPIIGSALIQSTSGEVWTPIVTMLAFSVVFALPFTLFALFPSWLKQLPKSGGWLNSVKVVLGFVELALGMKFLSVADQTYHWGLLDREVFALADKHHLPELIKDFIRTHHGLGKTKYFYITYKNEHPDEQVDESIFTYPGPNPSTKEQAILMMADAVEAASRSLKEYTEESISNLVDKIIDAQMSEGYFLNCDITFREISVAKTVFKEKLKIIYHTRISYPELK